ncbi:hypothetical protein GCM10023115_02740 [Pontixanthobacter gangjinensis]
MRSDYDRFANFTKIARWELRQFVGYGEDNGSVNPWSFKLEMLQNAPTKLRDMKSFAWRVVLRYGLKRPDWGFRFPGPQDWKRVFRPRRFLIAHWAKIRRYDLDYGL